MLTSWHDDVGEGRPAQVTGRGWPDWCQVQTSVEFLCQNNAVQADKKYYVYNNAKRIIWKNTTWTPAATTVAVRSKWANWSVPNMLQSQSSICVVALLFCVFVRKNRRQLAVDYIGIELKEKRNKSPCGVLPSSRALVGAQLRTIPSAGSPVGQIESGSDVSPSSRHGDRLYCDLMSWEAINRWCSNKHQIRIKQTGGDLASHASVSTYWYDMILVLVQGSNQSSTSKSAWKTDDKTKGEEGLSLPASCCMAEFLRPWCVGASVPFSDASV